MQESKPIFKFATNFLRLVY